MSAFFIAINRDKSKFDPHIARNMMGALAVFGHDQACLVVQDYFALGYQSLWTVPEEQGEVQPLYNDSLNIQQEQSNNGSWFLFDGRIDNRSELIKRLDFDQTYCLSDAQLLFSFYQCFGKAALNEVIGPFVFVVFNITDQSIFVARDGMGGRNIVFRVCEKFILIATYEMALVAHPSVEYKFNHSRIARVIARLVEDNLSSPIAGLMPLEPGEYLELQGLDDGSITQDYFYRLNGSKRTLLANEQAYADRFKELLTRAVRRRARTIGPVGSMLSGGFDSVPMSIVLAQQLAAESKELTAFSWVFDRYPEVDERQYSTEICQRFKIKQVCINADDIWPKFDDKTYVNPVMPFSIPYVELQKAALNEANARGVRSVLSGVHGDLLYGYTDSILWELLKQKSWRKLIQESRFRLKLSDSFAQWFKRYVLRPIPFVARALEKRRIKEPIRSNLLADHILKKMKNTTPATAVEASKSLRPIAYHLVFGGFAGEDIAYGRHIDAGYGIDRRYPFRDRDLCEFLLSIPGEQLFFNGVTRPIVRRAFESELPQKMLQRMDKTSFYPLVQSGIENDTQFMKWFEKPGAGWHFYVKKCYFDHMDDKEVGVNVVRWQCGYYDYWMSICYDSASLTGD